MRFLSSALIAAALFVFAGSARADLREFKLKFIRPSVLAEQLSASKSSTLPDGVSGVRADNERRVLIAVGSEAGLDSLAQLVGLLDIAPKKARLTITLAPAPGSREKPLTRALVLANNSGGDVSFGSGAARVDMPIFLKLNADGGYTINASPRWQTGGILNTIQTLRRLSPGKPITIALDKRSLKITAVPAK